MSATYPPGSAINVRDGGLGRSILGASLPLIVGVTSLGTANTLHRFSNSGSLVTTLGRGPAINVAAPIADRGGCLVLKTAATTAGVAGTVTKSAVGSSTGTVTVAGAPYDNLKVRIQIMATGTLGAGKFRYALDGHSNTEAYTWSPTYTIPSGGTFALPQTNLTLTFVPGAGTTYFEAGDAHRFDCTAPHYTTADLTAAFGVLLAQLGTLRVRRVMMAGLNPTATGAVTLAAAVAGHLDALAEQFHFARAILDGGSSDSTANFKTAIASFVDDRIGLVFGRCSLTSEVPFAGFGCPEVSAMDAVAERFAQTELSENVGRVLSGALRGVMRISHDEGVAPEFTAEDRIITLRTHPNEAGFFVTQGYLRSSPTSDFEYLDYGTVIDEFCQIVHDNLQRWLNAKLRSKTDGTGRMLAEDAARVEAVTQRVIRKTLLEPTNIEGFKGHVSGAAYNVDQTTDFLDSQTITGFGRAVPLVNVSGTETDIGFVRSL